MTASNPLTRPVAKAFAPGNISGLFKIIPNDDPRKMHSLGWGFTVEDGVEVEVRTTERPETQVTFNGRIFDFPTVRGALAAFTDTSLSVDITTDLPISSGFGLSGASTLAALIATNHLLELGAEARDLAMIAHVAEVEQLTGLGDVCAQFNGGCLVKTNPGSPLDATRIPMRQTPIHWRYFGKISTREILADHERHELINRAADEVLKIIQDSLAAATQIALTDLIQLALRFTKTSGLLMDERVERTIMGARQNGEHASMIMLGNAVFSTAPFEGSRQTNLANTIAHLVTN